ncbi:uncharacterized protein BKA78DRAFT_304255 [Phyllosticta capitalensis]|uniref:uncharacterized protein n=1 Tax=Phyllosticta capitalensis TaxID=121624 RepID=UPI00312EB859
MGRSSGSFRLQYLSMTSMNCKMTGLDSRLERRYPRRCQRTTGRNRSPRYRHRRQTSENSRAPPR